MSAKSADSYSVRVLLMLTWKQQHNMSKLNHKSPVAKHHFLLPLQGSKFNHHSALAFISHFLASSFSMNAQIFS